MDETILCSMPSRLPPFAAKRPSPQDDGTRQLLQWGGSMVATGFFAALLLETVLGGYSRTGATTNTGWFALIVALMCIPFGLMLFSLGIAKWFRNRHIGKQNRDLRR